MFVNRKEAALKIAAAVQKQNYKDVVVLGIPRGGVETAFYLSQALGLGFTPIIICRLEKQGHKQSTFGAVSENANIFRNRISKRTSQEMIDSMEDVAKIEIKRQIDKFRSKKPFPDITNKTVIIADDMIITGATMMAAIMMCKEKGAAKIVVASPFCNQAIQSQLAFESDDLIIVEMSKKSLTENQVYYSLYEPSDKEVMYFVRKAQKKESASMKD